MNLKSLGWSPYFESDDIDSSMVARVLTVHRSHVRAVKHNKELNLYLPGSFQGSVAVGDWVETSPEFIDEQGQPAAVIQSLIERKTRISRWTEGGEQVLAANIDRVFVVTSANQDFNLNRLQRYLLLIRQGGAEPVVVISKSDLTPEVESLISEVEETLKIKALAVSSIQRDGIKEILEMIPEGSSAVFVGSSGVGKSTLVNTLLQRDVQTTQEIREDDGKGRHTTTSRQMFSIPGGGMIIDTPGIREVQVFGEDEAIEDAFPQISQLIRECKFSDCKHENEPGCAIRTALENGSLEEREWNNYLKLQREVAFAMRKANKQEASNAKKRWRDIQVNMRKRKKFEEGG